MTTALHPEDPRQLGRHHLIARLGAGGMGQVYLARSPGGRLTAGKTIHEHLAADPHYTAQCPPAVAPDGVTVYAAAGRACAALRTTAKGLTETHTRTAPAPVTALTADTLGWYACAGRKAVMTVNG